MQTIEVKVTEQKIERMNTPWAVENTQGYLACKFQFQGEGWENTIRTAYFQNPVAKTKHAQILNENDTCMIPWEALTDVGRVEFSVAGEREGYRITTGVEYFFNGTTIYGGKPSEPPTPDQYDQMIGLAAETKEIAESVREDAEAGKFDGRDGENGATYTPEVSSVGELNWTNDKGLPNPPAVNIMGPQGPKGIDGQDATPEQVQDAVDSYMEQHPIPPTPVDATLTKSGEAADAKVTGDKIRELRIVETAVGTNMELTDSVEEPLQGLQVYGKTEQAGTPNVDASVPLVSPGDSGDITIQIGEQTLELSTPNGLPGVPTESGGNYTDTSGRQWITDTVDFSSGKYIQRIKKVRVEAITIYSASENFGAYIDNDMLNLIDESQRTPMLSTHFHFQKSGKEDGVCFGWGNAVRLYYNLGSLEAFNAWLAENEVYVMYPLAEPVETDLSQEELEAYASLHTVYPATGISNSDSAEMAVKYIADTKAYIDKKIEGIRTELINTQAQLL